MPSLAADEVVVRDFETGDGSQWPAHGYAKSDWHDYPFRVSDERSRGGRYAGRFEVRYLDRGTRVNQRGELYEYKLRSEVFESPVDYGSEWFYGFSSLVDPSWQDTPAAHFQHITQWHVHGQGPSPLHIEYMEPKLRVQCLCEICGGCPSDGKVFRVLYETDIAKGEWQDWVFQVRWHAEDGLIRAWHDGREVVAATGLPTCRAGARPYFKFGIYRGGSNQGNQVIWHDEYRRGHSRAAVDPAAARQR